MVCAVCLTSVLAQTLPHQVVHARQCHPAETESKLQGRPSSDFLIASRSHSDRTGGAAMQADLPTGREQRNGAKVVPRIECKAGLSLRDEGGPGVRLRARKR